MFLSACDRARNDLRVNLGENLKREVKAVNILDDVSSHRRNIFWRLSCAHDTVVIDNESDNVSIPRENSHYSHFTRRTVSPLLGPIGACFIEQCIRNRSQLKSSITPKQPPVECVDVRHITMMTSSDFVHASKTILSSEINTKLLG